WTATAGSLVASGLDRRAVDQLIATRGAYDPRRDLDRLETLGATALTWRDPEYPAPLLAVVDAPPVLFVRGRLDALLAPSVAIVGTRRATGYGREQSERFATDLVRAGCGPFPGTQPDHFRIEPRDTCDRGSTRVRRADHHHVRQ
ncbi:MAG: hypothetical protein EB140_10415, partial [Proteobacteria bacterium]|nr:hypothetical protein [Pseudomonadota bacterium]